MMTTTTTTTILMLEEDLLMPNRTRTVERRGDEVEVEVEVEGEKTMLWTKTIENGVLEEEEKRTMTTRGTGGGTRVRAGEEGEGREEETGGNW
jgi:hypothetical protein